MNRKKYLNRIGLKKIKLFPNFEMLKLLQKQHLLHIPFENLDIHWKNPVKLNTKNLYEKIIEKKRGGFCYELNSLFFELLNELGFENKIISARVFNGKDFGAEFDHLGILTTINGGVFLVDVGFGDFTAAPLKFVLDIEQTDENGTFLIRKFNENYFEVVKKDGKTWASEYIFKDTARDLQEFSEMCNFHQTSPESHFTRGKLCSLLTVNGRKTLTDKKFIETQDGEKIETKIKSEEDFYRILAQEFQIKKAENRA